MAFRLGLLALASAALLAPRLAGAQVQAPPPPVPAAAPPAAPPPAPAPPPAAAPAPGQPVQAPPPAAAGAAPAAAAPGMQPSNETLPWYRPREGEAYTPPPPPAPPPPPEPPPLRLLLGAYTQTSSFFALGDLDGSVTEIGARLGWAQGFGSVGLGLFPSDGIPVLSLDIGRSAGAELSSGTVQLILLSPTFQTKLVTDFGDNVIFVLGGSATGLRVTSCKALPIPFYVDVRAPYLDAWLPFVTAGGGIAESGAIPALSWGWGLEAGILFF